MKNILLIVCFITINYTAYSQDFRDDILLPTKQVDIPSINSSSTLGRLQDEKRGVIQIWYEYASTGSVGKSTGILLNSVHNTFDQVGIQKVYILTAHHYISTAVSDDIINIWISFDYELPDDLRDITHIRNIQQRHSIQRLYKTPCRVVVANDDADIILLEVDFSEILLKEHKAFLNSFAAGWNLHPDYVSKGFSAISHPLLGPKKMFYNYSGGIVNDHEPGSQYRFIELYSSKWANYVKNTQKNSLRSGCCGTSLLDKNGLSFALAKRFDLEYTVFTLLENVWIDGHDGHDDSVFKGIMHYLDPYKTWISSVPGGYLKDLIPNDPIDFDFEVTQSGIHKQINIDALDFFRFGNNININTNILGDGIIPGEAYNNNKVILTVTPFYRQDYLIYGTYYDNSIAIPPLHNKVFKGGHWDSKKPYENSIFSTNSLDNSKDIKKSILTHFKYSTDQDTDTDVKFLSSFNFDANLIIQTISGTANVRAIKLPNMMPYNTVELFEHERFINLWQSKKYPESRGNNSNTLNINKIKVELKAFIYNEEEGSCDELDYYKLQDITSGNNGGYLNLVNPNYQIDNVLSSDSRCSKNKLKTTLYTDTNTLKHYAAWVDYTRLPTPPDDLLYTFIDASTPNSSSTNQDIVIEYDIPYESELPFTTVDENNTNNTIEARYRVGVANTAMTSSGTYDQGEVEDYFLNVKKNNSMTRLEWQNLVTPAILMTGAGIGLGQCLPDGTGNGNGDATGEGEGIPEGIDQSFPVYKLPFFSIGDQSCFDILDVFNTYIGQNAIIFDGNLYMGVAQGADIVHTPSAEKTVSVDFLVNNTETTTNEIIFEEGGGANGISIRRNNNEIEFGVRINNQLVTLESTSTLVANQMMNVTIVFDNGVMELYINGELESSSNQFATQNITTLPEHLDNAALGGTIGTSIWDTVVNNFNGVVDYFAYWSEALTPAVIGILAINIVPQNNNARDVKQNTDTNISAKEADFSVFPNPAKDEINVMVEVLESGPLSVNIFDLSGRKVYGIKEANITQGHQLITLKNLNITSGTYIIKTQAGNVSRSERVVIE